MANEIIRIEFAVEGVQALKGVFDSLEQRMVRFDRAATSSTERSSRERVASARREVDQREKEYAKLSREAAKWEKQSVKEADRAAKDRTRSAEVEEKRKLAIKETSMRMAHRLLEQEVAAEKRAGEEKVRVAEQVAKREAAVAKQYRSRITGAMGTGLGNFATRGTQLIGTGMAIGGGFAVANAMRGSISHERMANALSISAYNPYGEGDNAFTANRNDPRLSSRNILGRASAVQGKTGVDKGELIQGWQEYVKLSSDFSGGEKNLDEFAKLSVASGTDFKELMQTAGTLRVQNKNLGAEGMMDLLRGVIGQGKMGAVEFTDLAKYAGAATASSGLYAGDQATNQGKLLGLMQIARRTTNGPADAATVMSRIGEDLASNADHIKGGTRRARGIGIDVLDANHKVKELSDVIPAMLEKTGGDTGRLQHLGIGRESVKLIQALLPTFNDAGGGAKGAAAVKSEMIKYESAGYSKQNVESEFAQTMSTNGSRIELALKKLGDVAENQATPFVEKFAKALVEHEPEIEKLLGTLGDVADFMVSHPWQALFMTMEAEMLKSVAAAAIGEAVKKALVGGTTAGFAGGAALAAPIIAAAMALAIQTGIAMIDQVDKDAARNQGAAATGSARSEALSLRIKRGVATPAEIEEAKALQGRLKNLAETGTTEGGDAAKAAHRYSRIAASVAGSVGFSDPKTQMDREQAATNAALAKLTAALEEATKRGFGGAGAPASGGDSSRPGAKPQSHAPMSDSSRGGLQH